MEFSRENRLHVSEEDEDEEGEVQHKSRGLLLAVEMEHMFEKVVTPSDVGKLNRLVIPKQHAEKYFPLDASSHEKGLLLSFEDRSGRPWRFRYSYWNSSQSYVMTKGWSRFVREKHLDAGDTVSFGRGTGHTAPHRLFIDWKRCRPESPRLMMPSVSSSSSFHPYLSFSRSTSAPWVAGRLFIPRPSPPAPSFARSVPAVLDSVLVRHEIDAVAPKCVRLFGVNLGEAVATPLGAGRNSSSS